MLYRVNIYGEMATFNLKNGKIVFDNPRVVTYTLHDKEWKELQKEVIRQTQDAVEQKIVEWFGRVDPINREMKCLTHARK